MRLEFKQSIPNDFLYLARNSTDPINSNLDDKTILTGAMKHISSGSAFTGFLNDKLMCAAGIHFKREGIGSIWSLFSKDCEKYKITVFRSIKEMLDIVIKNYGIKKIQSESRKGFEQSQRLLEHLGFIRQRRDMINGQYYFYLKES